MQLVRIGSWLLLVACGADADAPPADAPSAPRDTYLLHCASMYAARVAELQIEADPSFPLDCDAPLASSIAACVAGESANACRTRIYDQPPAISALAAGCTGSNCLRGMWLPRCSDGTDTCAEPDVVCPDGTRAMIYVEPARGGPSDKWIIYTGGEGGPCSGEACWSMYRYADLAGDQEQEIAMSTLHPDYRTAGSRPGAGITFGGTGSVLAEFNRVEYKRCGEAASDGVGTVSLTDGIPALLASRWPAGTPLERRRSEVPIWWRGNAIQRATFHALAHPIDLDGDGRAELSPLSSATTVVLAGSSDAAAYLALAGDSLAAELRAIQPAVDVRLVLDAHFAPALDSEGRFAPGAPADFNLFDDPYAVTGLCGPLPDNADGIANETCSDGDWRAGPNADGYPTWYDAFTQRGSVGDASCLASHPADPTPCFDDFHVAIEHASTPVMVIADQEDHLVNDKSAMADSKTYGFPLPEYRTRVLAQAADIEALWPTRREEPGAPGGIAMVLLKERRDGQPEARATHVHLATTASTHGTAMTKCAALDQPLDTMTLADAIVRWTSGTLTDRFAIEDARRATSPFWVTGTSCRPPE